MKKKQNNFPVTSMVGDYFLATTASNISLFNSDRRLPIPLFLSLGLASSPASGLEVVAAKHHFYQQEARLKVVEGMSYEVGCYLTSLSHPA